MNQKVYKRICSRIGHDWAFKDEGDWILKVCLNCGCEQYFFPEEVEEFADLDADRTSDDSQERDRAIV